MEELLMGEKKYYSSRKTGKILSYTNDYVGKLCREGKLDGVLVGRTWYVSEESLAPSMKLQESEKIQRDQQQSTQMAQAYKNQIQGAQGHYNPPSKVWAALGLIFFPAFIFVLFTADYDISARLIKNTAAAFNSMEELPLNLVSKIDLDIIAPERLWASVVSISENNGSGKFSEIAFEKADELFESIGGGVTEVWGSYLRLAKNTSDFITNKPVDLAFELSNFYAHSFKDFNATAYFVSESATELYKPLLADSLAAVRNVPIEFWNLANTATQMADRAGETIAKSVSGAVEDYKSSLDIAMESWRNDQSDEDNLAASASIALESSSSEKPSIWDRMIDSISDSLVPLFWNGSVAVMPVDVAPQPVVAISTVPVVGMIPNRSVTLNNIIERTIYSGATRSELTLAIERLRLEMLILNIDTRNVADRMRRLQAESDDGDGDVDLSSISGAAITDSSADLNTLVVDVDTLVIDEENNRVGIGTSSPYATLSVVGNLALTGGIYDNNATLGTDGYVLQTTGSGVEWVATSSLGITAGGSGSVNTGTAGYFAYYPASDTTVDDQTILNISGSNIGIGTTSPYAKLSVVGQVVGSYFTATTTATSTFPTLSVTGRLYTGSGNAGVNGMVLQTTGTGITWVATSSLGISATQWSTSGSNIFYPTGHVTVGSSANPDYSLYVDGGFSVSDEDGEGIWLSSKTGIIFKDANEDVMYRYSTTTESQSFSIGGTEVFLIASTTKVGIYENMPGSVLSVAGNASVGASYSRADGPLNGLIVQGNVGIGTTSPYAKLSVVGQVVGSYFTATTSTASTFPNASTTNLSVAGRFYDGSSSAGTNGMVLQTSGSVTNWVETSSLGLVNSVSNSDGTLTISPTTGAVAASLNLSNANTWASAQTFNQINWSGGNTVFDPSGNIYYIDGTLLANYSNQIFGDGSGLTGVSHGGEAVSQFSNDSSYLTPGSNISDLTNNLGYITSISGLDHGLLGGLTDDDHTQYALLAGRSGGQTLIGGTASGNSLTLRSSSNATKGKVIFGLAGTTAYDEVNERLGIGTASPTNVLSFGNSAAQKLWIENTSSGTVGRALTVAAGSTVSGSTDITGGNLILQSGLGTGTGASTISLQTGTTLTTGTTLQTMSTKLTILGNGFVGIGQTTPTALLHLVTTAPASVATSPGTAGDAVLLLAPAAGGATSIATTGVGGVGGATTITTGAGGVATAAVTSATGGNGGLLTISTGAGAAVTLSSSNPKIGGIGGAVSFLAGSGGNSSGTGSGTNTGGLGGGITLQGGAGGFAFSGSGTNTSGNGGDVTIKGGTGRTGGTTYIYGGSSNGDAGSTPGELYLFGGIQTAIGTGGPGAGFNMQASNASGDNTVSRAGGGFTMSAGNSKGDATGGFITITSGTGAVGIGSTGVTGGPMTISAGAGGAGSSTGGSGGVLTLNGGLGGDSTSDGTGGAITFNTASTITRAEVMRISASGNVGIGTTSPYAKLSVVGEVAALRFTATSTTATSTIYGFLDVLGTGSNATSTYSGNLWVKGSLQIGGGSLHLKTDSITSSDGNLTLSSVATSTFQNSVDLSGAVHMTGLSTDSLTIGIPGVICLDSNSEVRRLAGVATCIVSSRDFKKNIVDLSHGLDWISTMRPVTFDYKANDEASLGFIAEEMDEVTPLLTARDSKGKVFTVRYELITSVLVKAVQEIKAMIDDLTVKVEKMFAWFTDDAFSVQGDVCVDDVCVSKDQFKAMLLNAGSPGGDDSPEPEPDPTPIPPDPNPIPEPDPEPIPDVQDPDPSPDPEEGGAGDGDEEPPVEGNDGQEGESDGADEPQGGASESGPDSGV